MASFIKLHRRQTYTGLANAADAPGLAVFALMNFPESADLLFVFLWTTTTSASTTSATATTTMMMSTLESVPLDPDDPVWDVNTTAVGLDVSGEAVTGAAVTGDDVVGVRVVVVTATQ